MDSTENFGVQAILQFLHRDIQNKASRCGAGKHETIFGLESDHIIHLDHHQPLTGSRQQSFEAFVIAPDVSELLLVRRGPDVIQSIETFGKSLLSYRLQKVVESM